MSWLQRWNQRRKLDRGRCQNCGRPLRDDVTTRYCSEVCVDDWQSKAAW